MILKHLIKHLISLAAEHGEEIPVSIETNDKRFLGYRVLNIEQIQLGLNKDSIQYVHEQKGYQFIPNKKIRVIVG